MKTFILSTVLTLLVVGANAQWNTAGNDIYNTNTGNVGVGTSSPTSKLEILGAGTANATSLLLRNNSNSNQIAVYSYTNTDFHHSVLTLFRARGTSGSPSSVSAGDRIGSVGAGPYINGAFRGSVSIDFYTGSTPGSTSYPAYMIFGTTPNNGTSRIERMRIAESGNVGIGTSAPSYLLHVNGAVAATNYQTISDKRFKRNIEPLNDALEKIVKLSGYSYFLQQTPGQNFPDGIQFGLVAQEVNNVFPEVVQKDSEGYFSVNYQALIPIIVEAIKSLKVEVDAQKKYSQTNPLEDSYVIGASLHQNFPNPASGITSIGFSLPDQTKSARIMLCDLKGGEIKSIALETKGTGIVDVITSDLAPGLYLYTLVIDGKAAQTKKLLVEK